MECETNDGQVATLEEGQLEKDSPQTLEERAEGYSKEINELKAEADALGVDRTEYISDRLARNPTRYVKRYTKENLEEKSKYALREKNSAKGERTLDGVAALIYHPDPRNEEVYVKLEINPESYYVEKERNKSRLPGGAIDTTDPSPLLALVREIGEEFSDKKAQAILISELLESRDLYRVVVEDVNGKLSYTYVYLIKIESPEEWKIVDESSSTHDAGPFVTWNSKQSLSRKPEDFAWKHGNVLWQFYSDFFPVQYWETLHGRSYDSSNNPTYSFSKYVKQSTPLDYRVLATK